MANIEQRLRNLELSSLNTDAIEATVAHESAMIDRALEAMDAADGDPEIEHEPLTTEARARLAEAIRRDLAHALDGDQGKEIQQRARTRVVTAARG